MQNSELPIVKAGGTYSYLLDFQGLMKLYLNFATSCTDLLEVLVHLEVFRHIFYDFDEISNSVEQDPFSEPNNRASGWSRHRTPSVDTTVHYHFHMST
jgi:hypothetical protein